MLIDKANSDGVFENFGQKEVREIKEKFIDIKDYSSIMNRNRIKLDNFDNWCLNYTEK